MIKLDLTQFIVSLKGTPAKNSENEDLTLGMVLANVVLAPRKARKGFRPLQAWELAQKFYGQKEIELDLSHVSQIKEILESDDQTQLPFVVGQTLEYIIKAENEATK